MDKGAKHLLIMLLCCIAPFVALLGLIYWFDIRNSYLYWGAILICIGSHLVMMKYLHKDKEACH